MARMPWDALFDQADDFDRAALSHAHGSDTREAMQARAKLYRAAGARMRACDYKAQLTWEPADPEARGDA